MEEALGITDLVRDPVGISKEVKEDIIHQRGEESIEQVI